MQSVLEGGEMAASRKKVVYFNEYNVLMGQATYFPLVSGILRAYAQTVPEVKAAYSFKPFIFHLDSLENVLAKYDEAPDVAAFSIAMWNEQLSLRVAEEIKRRWPQCLIVFGGCQLPHNPKEYFVLHPFIDVGVRAEGEEAFLSIMERFLESREFGGIVNVSYRHPVSGEFVYNSEVPEFARGLDAYPSPYLEGLFDDMFEKYSDIEFQAIIETNRGCPFLCTFCYWGRGGTTRKYRYHDLDRVEGEIDWAGRSKVRYIFNADSNFGMHKRDPEVAKFLIETKKKYGFPTKFRTCWGKNTDENIFRIATMLHEHDLDKGVTLARQSNSKTVLANIKRGNIKLSTYENLQLHFNDRNIPVYSEMILGLPGETYESWRDGTEELLRAGLKNQLFVYQCEVYPNTELGEPEYQKKFGIRTHRIQLREIHGIIRSESWVPEFQDIIVETAAMSQADWKRMSRFSIVTMLMHSMKVGFFVISYLTDRFSIPYTSFIEYTNDREMPKGIAPLLEGELDLHDQYLDSLLAGVGRGVVLPSYGDFYWDIEESSMLRLAENFDRFYDQLTTLIAQFLKDKGVSFDVNELAEVVAYQKLRMPSLGVRPTEMEFAFNVPEYFSHRFGTSRIAIRRDRQRMLTSPKDFGGDAVHFARETILWGRKSGTLLVGCDWFSLDRPWISSGAVVAPPALEASLSLPRAANPGVE